MQVYKTKPFARFCRREGLADANLIEAVERAAHGLVDANLGGGLIKQRVARPGQGSRGGFRTIIAYRDGDIAVFLYGFAKSERANIAEDEASDLRALAGVWLGDGTKVAKDVAAGILIEVTS